MSAFYGKYRGKVELTVDPQQLGRVMVSCPDVLGDSTLAWAMPCMPYAGNKLGLFAIPPKGTNVWIEFEGGDPDRPILAGCFWGRGEVPASPAIEQMKVLKTDGITITMSDVPGAGGLTIEVKPPVVTTPLKLTFDASGIELKNSSASVKLTAASVSVNNGALEVI